MQGEVTDEFASASPRRHTTKFTEVNPDKIPRAAQATKRQVHEGTEGLLNVALHVNPRWTLTSGGPSHATYRRAAQVARYRITRSPSCLTATATTGRYRRAAAVRDGQGRRVSVHAEPEVPAIPGEVERLSRPLPGDGQPGSMASAVVPRLALLRGRRRAPARSGIDRTGDRLAFRADACRRNPASPSSRQP